MARTIPEWTGKTDDSSPPPRVMLRVFEAHGGKCYLCGIKLGGSQPWQMDHRQELADGGENRESNLAPACTGCHRDKTSRSATGRAASRRVRAKAAGIAKSRHPLPGGRSSGWKRKVDGTWERR